MIELVLEIQDTAEEMAVRSLVGRREGITLIGPGGQRLDERIDVDTLLVEDWPIVGRRGWVVVDEAANISVLLDGASIIPSDKARASGVAASWVVTLGYSSGYEGDYRRLAHGMDPDAVRDAGRGENYIYENELHWLPEFLNAFEVMERHNATGAIPPIRCVGIAVRPLWLPGMLRAYDTYRERALTGAYGPQEPPDGGSDT